MGIFNKEYIIGLDIGSSAVKMAQFVRKENRLYLARAAMEEFGLITDETLYQKQIRVSLKSLLRGIEPEKSKFVVTINCPRTAVKSILMPIMPQQELEDGIKLSAKNYFPFPLGEPVFDFNLQQEVEDNAVKKYQLLVATTSRATIERYLSLLDQAGIRPVSLIPIDCALEKLKQISFSEVKGNICFLDLGCRFSELVIFKGGKIAFARKIPVSGMDFTRALTDILVSDQGKTEFTLSEAEKLKKEVGIPALGSQIPAEYKISPSQMLSMLRPSLEQLAGEIERCFAYFREESPGAKVSALYLFGGSAALKGLNSFLEELLGIEVRVFSPWQENKEVISPQLASAVGAALSEARGINLLPKEIKEQKKRTFLRAGWEAALAALALITLFIYIGMQIYLGNLQKKNASARFELNTLIPQLKESEPQFLLNKIISSQPLWEDVFKEISNTIPEGVVIEELSLRGRQLVLRGKTTSAAAEKLLVNFPASLNKDIFQQAQLRQTEKGFELECQI